MIPRFPELCPLTLAHRATFETFAARREVAICELSFANLYLWKDFDRPQLTILQDALCVRIQPLDEPAFFLPPLGDGDFGILAGELLKHTGRISRASKWHGDALSQASVQVHRMRDHDDYCYRVADLAELQGRRFDAKRNHIKAFQHRFPAYRCRALSASDKDAALSIFERWHAPKIGKPGGGATSDHLEFECQRWALARSFEAFEALHLFGMALDLPQGLAGFVLASRLNSETVCVHLEYHLPGIQGIAQTLFWESCRTTFAPYRLINLEQDLGIEGLRRHKLSYHPLHLEEKYDIGVKSAQGE